MTIADFGLNLLVEVIGIVIGIIIGFRIAASAAQRRIDTIAPSAIRLIRQLREDGTLTPKAAQDCVVCAASLLSPNVAAEPETHTRKAGIESCVVCTLSYETVNPPGMQRRCANCSLGSNAWNIVKNTSERRPR